MDNKKAKKISCERARAFPIEKALAKLGHFPITTTEKEAWFLSPLRSENQASFKVSKKLNRWYDHGEGIGGNVIDLICKLKQCSVKEALEFIGEDKRSFFFQQQPSFKVEQQDRIVIQEVQELTHYALKEYLKSRYISMVISKKFIQEVHYQFKDKKYFAIGLKNDSGGWELRNKYYKNCSSPKDITHVKNRNDKLIVLEGMFDLLSIISLETTLVSEYDFLVMNSTAFVLKTRETMKNYKEIHLCLDTDANGQRNTKKLMEHFNTCFDKSMLYKDFKDVNQWLMNSSKDVLRQRIQDVFLLPQKQTCFTPDGRKENKK